MERFDPIDIFFIIIISAYFVTLTLIILGVSYHLLKKLITKKQAPKLVEINEDIKKEEAKMTLRKEKQTKASFKLSNLTIIRKLFMKKVTKPKLDSNTPKKEVESETIILNHLLSDLHETPSPITPSPVSLKLEEKAKEEPKETPKEETKKEAVSITKPKTALKPKTNPKPKSSKSKNGTKTAAKPKTIQTKKTNSSVNKTSTTPKKKTTTNKSSASKVKTTKTQTNASKSTPKKSAPKKKSNTPKKKSTTKIIQK